MKTVLHHQGQWLHVSAKILQEQRNRLQHLVLEISCQDKALGLFASNLARVRLAHGEMEDLLTMLLYADSPAFIDEVLCEIKRTRLLSEPAIYFLAELIREKLCLSAKEQEYIFPWPPSANRH